MFRKLVKNKKAQNTAEYAILISLVVAGIIAMQTYAQRALQARVRDAAVYLANQSGGNGLLGNTLQYEPYYLNQAYNVITNEAKIQRLDNRTSAFDEDSSRTREAGGFTNDAYDGTMSGAVNGM